jgi:hypothetical protein
VNKRSVVVIPFYRRPEFLHWCCERIKKAVGADKYLYLFCGDWGYDKQNIPIIDSFPFQKEIILRPNHKPEITKQSRNVLEGLKYAATISDSLIYLIEDDVMISTDYFAWHESVQNKELLFCSIASKNVNRTISKGSNQLGDYYLSTGDYCGIGTAFNAAVFNQLVVPHITEAYYNNCMSYVQNKFPNSSIGSQFAEQDGLIRRIQEASGLPTCFPFVPRSYHAGFYGKGRLQRTYIADLSRRIEFVGEVIHSKENMAKFALNEYFYYDSEPVNLEINEAYELNKIQI